MDNQTIDPYTKIVHSDWVVTKIQGRCSIMIWISLIFRMCRAR